MCCGAVSADVRYLPETFFGLNPKPVLMVNLGRYRMSAEIFVTNLQLHTQNEFEAVFDVASA